MPTASQREKPLKLKRRVLNITIVRWSCRGRKAAEVGESEKRRGADATTFSSALAFVERGGAWPRRLVGEGRKERGGGGGGGCYFSRASPRACVSPECPKNVTWRWSRRI